MCVIGYAPKNVTISDSTIRTMFENNPDGAGIMWKPEGKPIEIRKGFFSVKELLKAWHKVPVECEKAIHCRIATAGKVTAQCCHPFPVRECTRAMKSKSDCSDVAFMHNGIITLTDPPEGIRSPYSDSMMFGKEILYPLKNDLGNEYIQEMIEDSINYSRMLIFRQNGDTVRLGVWVKDGKCYFSNDSYKSTYYKYYSCGSTTKTVSKTQSLPKTETADKTDGVGKIAQTSTVAQQPAASVLKPNDVVSNPYGYEEIDLYDTNGTSMLLDDDSYKLDEQSDEYTVEDVAWDLLDGAVTFDEISLDVLPEVKEWFRVHWAELTLNEQIFIGNELDIYFDEKDGELSA